MDIDNNIKNEKIYIVKDLGMKPEVKLRKVHYKRKKEDIPEKIEEKSEEWVSPYDTKSRKRDDRDIYIDPHKNYKEAIEYINELKPTKKGEYFDSLYSE